jgi:hypothetical protein
MSQLLTYGLKDGALIRVSKVANGLSCNCLCPKCDSPLVAKNSPENKKIAHFAHVSGDECEGACETALHLLAKQVLIQLKTIFTPDFHHDYEPSNAKSIFRKGQLIAFDRVISETSVTIQGNSLIPDCIGVIGKKEVYIEFANTHFIDSEKREKLKKGNVSCMEINLSEVALDETELEKVLLFQTEKKYWIHNQRLDKEFEEYERKAIEKEENVRKTAFQRFNNYRNQGEVKIIEISQVTKHCPKGTERFNRLRKTRYFQHQVFKQIIEKRNWNGVFYGKIPYGRWIYYQGKKIIVYPPNIKRKEYTRAQHDEFDYLFAGLKKIQETLLDGEIGDCDNCKYLAETLSLDNTEYSICTYGKHKRDH